MLAFGLDFGRLVAEGLIAESARASSLRLPGELALALSGWRATRRKAHFVSRLSGGIRNDNARASGNPQKADLKSGSRHHVNLNDNVQCAGARHFEWIADHPDVMPVGVLSGKLPRYFAPDAHSRRLRSGSTAATSQRRRKVQAH